MNIVIKLSKSPEKITVNNHIGSTPDGVRVIHVNNDSPVFGFITPGETDHHAPH